MREIVYGASSAYPIPFSGSRVRLFALIGFVTFYVLENMVAVSRGAMRGMSGLAKHFDHVHYTERACLTTKPAGPGRANASEGAKGERSARPPFGGQVLGRPLKGAGGTMQSAEMALEAALLVMRNGGSTSAADRTFANILKGYHQEGVAAVWRLDFIATTNAVEGRSTTVVWPVGPIKVNLVRVSEVAVLGERVAKGEVAIAALGPEIERIKQLPSPYNRWVMMVTALSTAACYSQILAGDWGSLGIACVAAGVGQFLRSLLYARKLAVGPVTLICGVLSAMIAGFGLRLGFSQVEPATLVGAVIYMVPGLPLINGFVDVISHKYLLVGLQRIVDAAFLFMVLAIAIALAHTVVL